MGKRICALLGLAALSFAGKPGGGGGPPPDPAIAYVENGDLRVMNADGSNKTTIVAGAGILAQPSWSPDGTRIAFQQNGLYVVDRDGTDLTLLLSGTAAYPAWSPAAAPDGKQKIAFNRPGASSNEIWLVNTDGTGLQNLTATPDRTEIYATWSPDADRIAVSYQDLETQPDGTRAITARGLLVYHLVAGTSDPIEIASTDVVLTGGPGAVLPGLTDWERTGDRIAYASGGNLFVLDLASPSTPQQLTSTSDLTEASPSWSPDDSRIVFERYGSGSAAKQSGIYVMNADGSGVTSLGAKYGTTPDRRR